MHLMREYAEHDSETAFAELVHRHINLVYSVALRHVGNSHDAQDITQAVFVIFAKKAASLRQRTNLTGWLYETTRFTSRQLSRTRARQQAREQEAYVQSTLNNPETESTWRQLAPLLEDAMSRLSEKERALVALRFFENKSAAETAARLGIQEWAAHKRAARAMEKLRLIFVKRGIASTTATIAGAISANSVQAAPVTLAKMATAVALTKGATPSVPTLTLIKGAWKIMTWTKAKMAIVVGIGILLAAGTTTVVVVKAHTATNQRDSIAAQAGVMKESVAAQAGVMKGSVFPAIARFAIEHQDEIPKSIVDLKPYLPASADGMDDDHWQIPATGKLTPLLTRGDVILIEQKNVPPGEKRIILYTDGHVERK
jgi:RNA polymerase sigma factor (sigma-70 family)